MRSQTEIIAEMRVRIGGRRRLMAVLDVGQSTVQNWEDENPTVPSGQSVARLALMFPDLADELLCALAHGGDFNAESPPVIRPAEPAADRGRLPLDEMVPDRSNQQGTGEP